MHPSLIVPRLLALVLSLGLFALSSSTHVFAAPSKADADDNASKPPIPESSPLFILSLDWSGESLESHNLEAIAALRQAYPDLRLIHFISPLYFLGEGPQDALQKIKALVAPQDEFGVYLSAGRALAKKASIIFRSHPSFWGRDFKLSICQDSCGQDVPLTVYPKKDLNKLVATAIAVLKAQGFANITAMKVRAWLSNTDIMSAGRNQGIAYDFSGINVATVKDAIGYFPLYQWLEELWPAQGAAVSFKRLPPKDNKMMVLSTTLPIDLLSSKKIDTILTTMNKRTQPDDVPLLHIAFTQETAYQNMIKLRYALTRLKELNPKGQLPPPATLSDLESYRAKPRS